MIGIKSEVVGGYASFDVIEIAPDGEGHVCYKHSKRFLADESEASEAILDGFLCK